MEPEVLTGARGPRDQRLAQVAEQNSAKPAKFATGIPAGKVVFQAVAAKYKIQLTPATEQILPDGRKILGRATRADFSEGFLILDEKKDAFAISQIREHRDYGRDFWDFSEVLAAAKQAQVNAAISILADPVARKAIVEALRESGAEDFVLPSASQ